MKKKTVGILIPVIIDGRVLETEDENILIEIKK